VDAVVPGQPTKSSGSFAYIGQVLAVAVAYFAVARLALLAGASEEHAVVAVWPASGIALACLLLFGYRASPGVWLGATLASFALHASLIDAALLGTGALLEALAATVLVRRCIGLPRSFERGEDVVEFVAIAALSSAIAATVATVVLASTGSSVPQTLTGIWWTRWQADAMGIVIVAPLILNWSTRGADRSSRKALEMLCLAVPTLAATHAIFSDSLPADLPSLPLTFVILPFVIWAALRFAQREVATLNALVCAIAVWQTLEGHGPFASAPPETSPLLLLAFTSTVMITGLVLNAVVGERSRAIDALAQALKILREEAIRDPLTSLYNRRFLQDYLSRELVRAKREGIRVAVIMIDLDHFKRVNDTAGHSAGDEVLVQVAALLKRHIRGSDIACRFGGEEFTLVLPNATLQSARNRAEAICAAVREESDHLLGVTASLGVALFPDSSTEPAALLRAADQALYEAKGRGRNQVRVFSRGPAPVYTLRPGTPRRAHG
jgi:diguanylate cyclase (GGDEF)-like protein